MKTRYMELVELRRRQSLEELIRDLIEQGHTLEEVAEELGITRVTLYRWLDLLNARIETKRTVQFGTDEASETAVSP